MNDQDRSATKEDSWIAVDNADDGLQVRKMAGGLFMIRRGEDGTAMAITQAQLNKILDRSKNTAN